MNIVKDKLPALVDEEYAAAMKLYQHFSSAHEGYAVLLEEVEEAESEGGYLRHALQQIWDAVKHDEVQSVNVWAAEAYRKAIDLAAEAIQAAAMALKLLDSLKEMKKV